jgi:hypothetical protein
VWERRKLNGDRIARAHLPACGDDSHDAGLSDQLSIGCSLQNRRHLAGLHSKAGRPQLLEELCVHQVHLPQVGLSWIPGDPGAMLHHLSGVRISFDTVTCDQANTLLAGLTKRVPRAQAQRNYGAEHTVRIA